MTAVAQSRRDPVTLLPSEVLIDILTKLSQNDLYRSILVSKAWKSICLDAQLWKNLDENDFVIGDDNFSEDDFNKAQARFGAWIQTIRFHIRNLTLLRANVDRFGTVVNSIASNLVSLRIDNCNGFSPSSQRSSTTYYLPNNMINLRHLSIFGCATNDVSIIELHKRCPNLISLHLSFMSDSLDMTFRPGLFHAISKFTKLQSLALEGAYVKSGRTVSMEMTPFSYSFFKPSLLSLHLSYIPLYVTDSFLSKMVNAQSETSEFDLQSIDLSGSFSLITFTSFAGIVPQLRELRLANCTRLSTSSFRTFLPTVPLLEFIDCDRITALQDDFLDLLSTSCSKIRHAQLSEITNFSNNALVDFVKGCPQLRNLEIDGTLISDDGIYRICTYTRERSARVIRSFAETNPGQMKDFFPEIILRLSVYDCHDVTCMSLIHVLRRNTEQVWILNEPGFDNSMEVNNDLESVSVLPMNEFDSPVTSSSTISESPNYSVPPLSTEIPYMTPSSEVDAERVPPRKVSLGLIFLRTKYNHQPIMDMQTCFLDPSQRRPSYFPASVASPNSSGNLIPDYESAQKVELEFVKYCFYDNFFGFDEYLDDVHCPLVVPGNRTAYLNHLREGSDQNHTVDPALPDGPNASNGRLLRRILGAEITPGQSDQRKRFLGPLLAHACSPLNKSNATVSHEYHRIPIKHSYLHPDDADYLSDIQESQSWTEIPVLTSETIDNALGTPNSGNARYQTYTSRQLEVLNRPFILLFDASDHAAIRFHLSRFRSFHRLALHSYSHDPSAFLSPINLSRSLSSTNQIESRRSCLIM
ncbi:uncharacterized protein V1516DRAFT_680472 [Lipomyces oligophaga]|uniref:uncharacterized protein n=1 Tax=Lipomyces oligophaga TaxID=45792 RepID=UPI0034CEABF8